MAREIIKENNNVQLAKKYRFLQIAFTIAMIALLAIFLFEGFGMFLEKRPPLGDPNWELFFGLNNFSNDISSLSSSDMFLIMLKGKEKFFMAFLFAIFCSALAKHYKKKYKILSSGLVGEKFTQKTLSSLSDEYTIINNIPLEKDGRRTEIDSLIVSQYGVIVIETKNYNGSIIGKAEDSFWIQNKISQGGNSYSSERKNPLKQLSYQMYLLQSILKENRIEAWVDGYVLMPSASSISVNSDKVLKNKEEVYSVISQYKTKKVSTENVQKIISLFGSK